ncbi:MAG: bifunctional glutamate N-acetyltransferase/amino-acid acetyltransferase ArgJ [Syntrophaceae bacterium]|nr:bifunctional glutamate N-acetyltransferase/amino-acid acetyltransferase ArgJ [Syntrophaceae bacterium]
MESEIKVPGFLANGINCGIKEDGRRDLALIFSTRKATAAGVFTRNAFKAAPVLLDMERIVRGEGQAIIVNSGVANAATGEEGLRDAKAMTAAVSKTLKISDDLVYVASTGVIGRQVPVHKVEKAMPDLVAGLDEDGLPAAEEAIMTTDKMPKLAVAKAAINGRDVTVCGLAKGAGMIEPNMATMLSFILTDAVIERNTLDKLFRSAINKSFNSITVDGCMSTNDTVLILANGQAGGSAITGVKNTGLFGKMLSQVLSELSYLMVKDGEGATKVIEIVVKEARNHLEARKIAYAVANSNLVKTAFYGKDPNWGRIIGAIGTVNENIPVNAVRVDFNDTTIFADGCGVRGNEKKLLEIMELARIRVSIHMGMGRKTFRLLASDLTHEYVTINAHYTT